MSFHLSLGFARAQRTTGGKGETDSIKWNYGICEAEGLQERDFITVCFIM